MIICIFDKQKTVKTARKTFFLLAQFFFFCLKPIFNDGFLFFILKTVFVGRAEILKKFLFLYLFL